MPVTTFDKNNMLTSDAHLFSWIDWPKWFSLIQCLQRKRNSSPDTLLYDCDRPVTIPGCEKIDGDHFDSMQSFSIPTTEGFLLNTP